MNEDELKEIGLKIKQRSEFTYENECDKIRIELIESLKKFSKLPNMVGNEFKSNIINITSDKIKISSNANANKEIKVICNIDVNKFEKQLEKISNLKIKINLVKEEENYYWMKNLFWKIKIDY